MLATNDMGRFDVATTDALELPMFKVINKIPWYCIGTSLAFRLKSTTARYFPIQDYDTFIKHGVAWVRSTLLGFINILASVFGTKVVC
jgi:hypothetical protein